MYNKDFLLSEKSEYIENLINKRKHFYASSGRGGMEALIAILGLRKDDVVLVPALSPQGIIIPLERKKLKIKYYKVNSDLVPDTNQINQLIEEYNVKFLVIIHYFGISQPISELRNKIQSRELIIIEDCAQALYSRSKDGEPLGIEGDVALFSFPKFLPVPDGSLFVFNNDKIFNENIKYKFSILRYIGLLSHIVYLKLKALQKRRNFFFHSFIYNFFLKSIYFAYYKAISLQRNPTKISKHTLKIINHYNYSLALELRVRNTKLVKEYYSKNKEQTLIDVDLKNYFLTGFPIIAKKRNDVKSKLLKKNIETLAYNKYWFYFDQDDNIRSFPVEQKVNEEALFLPVSENNSEDEIVCMLNELKKIYL